MKATQVSKRKLSNLKKIVQELREIRKGVSRGKVNIRELIDGGRRY